MALTRKFLEEAGLNKEVLEKIIQAHGETVDALKKERDEWKRRAEAEEQASGRAEVQATFDAYKAQVEKERLEGRKTAALQKALAEAGVARAGFRELLLRGIDLAKVELDGENVKNAEAVIAPLKESYADCFSTLQTQGTPPLDPPGGVIRKTDLRQMSAQEINDNWEEISALLSGGK